MTKVIFKRFNDGDVIALFPALAGDSSPRTCMSYMHTGQHSAATAGAWLKPAAPEEYAPLLAELKRIGYDDLRIVRRFTRADLEARREQCK